jgi:dTDP-4-amino-4,6-dideoxygalactose transaminase
MPSRSERIPDARAIPVLDLSAELSEVSADLEGAWRRVVASGQFILGAEVDGFEREVASFLGRKHAIGVNSGTDALVIALRVLGIGPGDEVVTSAFSFFATSESVGAVGATPVFVDIDPATFNLSPELVEKALSPRTKAIIPVHVFGQPAEMQRIDALARRRGLAVIEDAAQAFGASCGGRPVGGWGRINAFSFFPSKNLGALGDGGLIVTDEDPLAEHARMLRAHGSRRKYFNEEIGYNSRLDALQAAFLRAKLPHVARWNALRRAAASRYRELLAGVEGIVLPVERSQGDHVYHQFTIRVQRGLRDLLRTKLSAEGIGTMVYYPKALHQLPVYRGALGRFPEAERAADEVLSIPFWPRIGPDVQERVAERISACLRDAAARP